MKTLKHFLLCSLLLFTLFSLFSCEDHHPVKIYIMAGQSNMEGPGRTAYLVENGMNKLLEERDDVWCVYAGRVSGPLLPEYGFRRGNFGPELLFGHQLGDELENSIILFKSALGGTTLHVDWRPPGAVERAGGEVGPLYNQMIRRFHTFLENLDQVYPGYDPKQGYEIGGFIWLQGESDCCQKTDEGIGFHEYYKENLDDFIDDVRRDVGLPELPVVIVQINDGVWDGKSCGGGPLVREIERKKAESDPNISLVVTMDLNDGYHYDNPSHIIIGERVAKAVLPFSGKPVHTNTSSIEKAGEDFFERIKKSTLEPKAGGLKKDLIGYWKFDTGNGQLVSDESPQGNQGQISGIADWKPGRFGTAVTLRKNNSIEIPGFKEPLGTHGTIENLSISFWIQTPGKAGHNRIGKGSGHALNYQDDTDWFISEQANDAGWDIGNFDYDGFPHFTASIEDNGAQTAYISWGEPTIDGDGFEWHHVAAVFEGLSGTMKIYCDGHLAAKQVSVPPGQGIIPSGTALKIGGGLLQENNFQAFDEIAIWARALSGSEIAAIYNNGSGMEL